MWNHFQIHGEDSSDEQALGDDIEQVGENNEVLEHDELKWSKIKKPLVFFVQNCHTVAWAGI